MRRLFSIAVCLALSAMLGRAQAPRFPFPQHTPYWPGTVLPSHVSRAEMDDSTRVFYDRWKAKYLRAGCSPGHFFVWFDDYDPDPGDTTMCVSEGQGYGMLITAFMAGYDSSARTLFDGLYYYFRAHPAAQNPDLMAWRQVSNCMTIPGSDDNSATDGDLDIAYALLLADRQWGSAGPVNYRQEALAVCSGILQEEINRSDYSVELGSWVVPGSSYLFSTRTSDFMPDHFRAFEAVAGNPAWLQVRERCYDIVRTLQHTASPLTGLLPDFAVDLNTSPQPAAPNFLESAHDGHYYWNACRTPWRLGLDYVLSGDTGAYAALQKINGWIRTKTAGNPAVIRAGYRLTGSQIASYGSTAFTAPLAVSAMVSSEHRQWLNALWDRIVSTPLEAEGYYENSLKMLVLLAVSGNWWTPAALAPAFQCSVTIGWNLVSVPVRVGNWLAGSLYAGSSSPVYRFIPNSGYVAAETLARGEGYWVKFPSDRTVAFAGTTRELDTIDLHPGWNIIGSLASPVLVDSLSSIPPSLSLSPFYGWGGTFTPVDTLLPGKGYWVKSSGAGGLVLRAIR
ncbi:MAG: glycosyl hydrolase family 8 [Bacteroidota bacterium]